MATKLFHRLSAGFTSDESIDWSKKGLAEWKRKIKTVGSKSRDVEPPRVLFIGETGSGKSSFISSIVSALKGQITYTSTIGESSGSKISTFQRFLEHRVFLEDDDGREEPLKFVLCDSRGFSKPRQGGGDSSETDREIHRLIGGQLRHGDLIDDFATDVTMHEARPPGCVVFVVKAQTLGDRDTNALRTVELACRLVKERGIPSCVVLTHIDVVKQSLKDDLQHALSSKAVRGHIKVAASCTGVNQNRVFVVKNYVSEHRTHTKQDILILRALHGILVDMAQKSGDQIFRYEAGAVYSDDAAAPLASKDLPLKEQLLYNNMPKPDVKLRPVSEPPVLDHSLKVKSWLDSGFSDSNFSSLIAPSFTSTVSNNDIRKYPVYDLDDLSIMDSVPAFEEPTTEKNSTSEVEVQTTPSDLLLHRPCPPCGHPRGPLELLLMVFVAYKTSPDMLLGCVDLYVLDRHVDSEQYRQHYNIGETSGVLHSISTVRVLDTIVNSKLTFKLHVVNQGGGTAWTHVTDQDGIVLNPQVQEVDMRSIVGCVVHPECFRSPTKVEWRLMTKTTTTTNPQSLILQVAVHLVTSDHLEVNIARLNVEVFPFADQDIWIQFLLSLELVQLERIAQSLDIDHLDVKNRSGEHYPRDLARRCVLLGASGLFKAVFTNFRLHPIQVMAHPRPVGPQFTTSFTACSGASAFRKPESTRSAGSGLNALSPSLISSASPHSDLFSQPEDGKSGTSAHAFAPEPTGNDDPHPWEIWGQERSVRYQVIQQAGGELSTSSSPTHNPFLSDESQSSEDLLIPSLLKTYLHLKKNE